MDNHRLTKEHYDKLFNENITVKEQKELDKLVGERFNYIVHKIAEIVGRKVNWYDYSNEGGSEHSPGTFDPNDYKENISYVGDIKVVQNTEFTNYDDDFPTVWLHEDFEEKIKKELNDFNVAQIAYKEKVIKEKTSFKKMVEVRQAEIMAKLTDEEKLYITVNSPDLVKANLERLDKQRQKQEKLDRAEFYKAQKKANKP